MQKNLPALIVSFGILSACQGFIDDGPLRPGERPPGTDPTDPTDPEEIPTEPTCNEQVGPRPRRLSRTEYQNSVRDTFSAANALPLTVAFDRAPRILENDVNFLTPSDTLVRQYFDNSRAIAEALVPGLSVCSDDTCRNNLVGSIGQQLFRRPLTSDEVTSFRSLFGGEASGDFATGATLMIQSLLQSPQFLYHDESHTLGQRISQYATAERMAYFLWGGPPDEALLAKAQQNQLTTRAQVAAEATAMLSDPRAVRQFRDFFRQWVNYEEVASSQKLPADNYDGEAATEEIDLFVDHLFTSGGTLSDLFTSEASFVNEYLADIYDVSFDPSGEPWQQVTLTGRPGILTRHAILAGYSRSQRPSPILRGIFIAEHVLCRPVGAPPAAASGITIEPMEANGSPVTNREIVENTTNQREPCVSCHQWVNPIGFAYEQFDQMGRFRTLDEGQPIDSSGALPSGETYEDHLQMSAVLAASAEVRSCMIGHWVRSAFGGGDQARDQCMIDEIVQDWQANGGTLRQLMLSIVTHPQFFAGLTSPAYSE